MIELLVILGGFIVFWTVLQTIFVSQNVNNFLSLIIFTILHVISYGIFLNSFTTLELDFSVFLYGIVIFLQHSITHIISFSFGKKTSYFFWAIAFSVINLILLITWYYLFFLQIL